MPENTDKRQLTPVLENYLETIFYLEIQEGAARVSLIADSAGVSRSTVSSMLRVLKDIGYITYEPYGLIHLTEAGAKIGREIAHRHLVFEEFLGGVLQVDSSVASEVACRLEHVVLPEVVHQLEKFLLFLHYHQDMWKNWQTEYDKLNLKANHENAVSKQKDSNFPLRNLKKRMSILKTQESDVSDSAYIPSAHQHN